MLSPRIATTVINIFTAGVNPKITTPRFHIIASPKTATPNSVTRTSVNSQSRTGANNQSGTNANSGSKASSSNNNGNNNNGKKEFKKKIQVKGKQKDDIRILQRIEI